MANQSKKTNSKSRLRKEYMSFYPEPEQAEALRGLSDKTGVPVQRYLREGVEHILEKYEWVRERSPDGKRNVHTLKPKKKR